MSLISCSQSYQRYNSPSPLPQKEPKKIDGNVQSSYKDEIQICTLAAIEAYSNGNLERKYFKDGKKEFIKNTNEIPSLIQKGFRVQNVDGILYLTRGLLGGSPLLPDNTQVLANELKDKQSKQNANYLLLETLALKIIDLFARSETKTKSLYDEVTALASSNNVVVMKQLFKVFVKEINKAELLEIEALIGLKATIINSIIEVDSEIKVFDPDDLIQVIKIVIQRFSLIHRQPETNHKFYIALSTLADILDVMSDAHIIKMDREKIHKPLYDTLDSLSNDSDLIVASLAAYAKQALVRVPDNESPFNSFFRHGKALVEGLTNIVKFVGKPDISLIPDTYNKLKEALNFQEWKKHWYGDIRALKLLSESKEFDKFTIVMNELIQDASNPNIIGNILFILYEIVRQGTNKEWALDRMKDLFQDDTRWGNDKKIKEFILNQIRACVRLKNISDYTIKTLATIKTEYISQIDQIDQNYKKSLIENALKGIEDIPPEEEQPTPSVFGGLIDEAKKSIIIPSGQKLIHLKEQTLGDKNILKELECYIPVLGSRNCFDPTKNTLDLENEIINQFLDNDEKKIFLLQGDSGGGKSTFLRYLEHRLWENWSPGKPIPLFVRLAALREPFNDGIKKILNEKGFNADEQLELKHRNSFLFLLDGYDELEDKRHLYDKHQLQEWNARVIVTCRTQYLQGEISNYAYLFSASEEILDEASTSPFTSQQIQKYYRKFTDAHPTPYTWEEFDSVIMANPDLKEMIENPFILKMVAEILPEKMKKYQQSQSQQKLEFLRVEIFDHYFNKKFDEEAHRLSQAGLDLQNIKEELFDFTRKLGLEMFMDSIHSVEYKDDSLPSKWKEFFGVDDRNKNLIRSSVPLRKIGSNTYAFNHDSLIEYFSSRAIIRDDKVSFKDINRKLFTTNPQIIRHLAECVSKNQALIDQLFAIIERSKDEPEAAPAAANAITILNAAGVKLTQRNFQGVRIPGADLSRALLSRTNLSEADLRNVKLNDANLDYATIANSDTEGLELGQIPFMKLPRGTRGTRSIAISPDGKSILSGNHDGSVTVLDWITGKELLNFRNHCSWLKSFYPTNAVAFSSDGKYALSGGNDNTVRLWDYISGRELQSFKHTDKVTSVAFSNNRPWILSGSLDGTVRLWDRSTGKELRSFLNDTDTHVSSVAFSPDSQSVLSASTGGIHVWDCETGKELLYNYQEADSNFLAISPDGKWVLSGWQEIHLWDCKTGEIRTRFEGHSGSIESVAFSPKPTNKDWTIDKALILSGGDDNTVRLWDCLTGKELLCFQGHSRFVTSVAFSPDGEWTFSGSYDRTLRVWNIKKITLQKAKGVDFPIDSWIDTSLDGKWIFSERFGAVIIWDCQTGKQHFKFKPIWSYERCVFSQNGKLAVFREYFHSKFRNDDHTISIWNCDQNKEFLRLPGHTSFVNSVVFSANDKFVASSSKDGTERIWDCENRIQSCFQRNDDSIEIVAISPNGDRALSRDTNNSIRLWWLQNWQGTLPLSKACR